MKLNEQYQKLLHQMHLVETKLNEFMIQLNYELIQIECYTGKKQNKLTRSLFKYELYRYLGINYPFFKKYCLVIFYLQYHNIWHGANPNYEKLILMTLYNKFINKKQCDEGIELINNLYNKPYLFNYIIYNDDERDFDDIKKRHIVFDRVYSLMFE